MKATSIRWHKEGMKHCFSGKHRRFSSLRRDVWPPERRGEFYERVNEGYYEVEKKERFRREFRSRLIIDAPRCPLAGLSSLIQWNEIETILSWFLSIVLRNGESEFLTFERLYDAVVDEFANRGCTARDLECFSNYEKLFRHLDQPDVPHSKENPNFSLLSIYARLGIKKKVRSFLRENCDSVRPEEKAPAYELLEAAPFDFIINKRLERPHGLRAGHHLIFSVKRRRSETITASLVVGTTG